MYVTSFESRKFLDRKIAPTYVLLDLDVPDPFTPREDIRDIVAALRRTDVYRPLTTRGTSCCTSAWHASVGSPLRPASARQRSGSAGGWAARPPTVQVQAGLRQPRAETKTAQETQAVSSLGR